MRHTPWVILAGVVLFVVAFLIMGPFKIVPSGHRGVVLNFGAVSQTTLNEGLHVVNPLGTSVVNMEVATRTHEVKGVDAASNDLQRIATDVAVTFHLDAAKVNTIYQQLNVKYIERILSPQIEEAVKQATAKYEAEKLVTQRHVVKALLDDDIRARVSPYGIVVESVSFTNFAFSEDFNRKIEEKVGAEQQALKAQNDLVRIKTEAEQRIAQAQGEAEAIRIQGEALERSPKLVELEAVRRWDGKLPTQMLGNAVPFVQTGTARR